MGESVHQFEYLQGEQGCFFMTLVSIKKQKDRDCAQIILNEFNDGSVVLENGNIQWKANWVEVSFDALTHLVKFSDKLYGLNKYRMVKQVVCQCLRDGDCGLNQFLIVLDECCKQKLSNSYKNYYFLSTLSFVVSNSFQEGGWEFSIDSVEIVISNQNFDGKFKGRDKLLRKLQWSQGENIRDFISQERGSYSNVTIKVREKSSERAAYKAGEVLDLIRGLLCFYLNPSIDYRSKLFHSLNVVGSGVLKSLHNESGSLIEDLFWWDYNYETKPAASVENEEALVEGFSWMLKKISNSKFSNELKEAFITYAKALDEREPHVAFVKIWVALESLLTENSGDQDKFIRRCACLYKNSNYHEVVLNHMKMLRNNIVHSGSESNHIRLHCQKLQKYFKSLIYFYTSEDVDTGSLQQANAFLDYFYEFDKMVKQESLYKKVMEIRSDNGLQ